MKKLIRRILCKANYDKCNGCEDYSCWKMKKQINKNYVFEICVCCQGQPFYHYRKTLVGALIEYAYQYLKKKKYGTMNFSLSQKFNWRGGK